MTKFYQRAKAQRHKNDGDDIWEEFPVSVREFFDKENGFIKEPFFEGPQQDYADAMLGVDPLAWPTEYKEGQALWGKGCLTPDTEILS